MLRNHIADSAIKQAEAGNYSAVQQLLEKLRHPFDDDAGEAASVVVAGDGTACGIGGSSRCGIVIDAKPPDWSCKVKVS